MWPASLKDTLAAMDMMALIWMGTGHIRNKETLTRRLETVGLRYGMRVDLEGK